MDKLSNVYIAEFLVDETLEMENDVIIILCDTVIYDKVFNKPDINSFIWK